MNLLHGYRGPTQLVSFTTLNFALVLPAILLHHLLKWVVVEGRTPDCYWHQRWALSPTIFRKESQVFQSNSETGPRWASPVDVPKPSSKAHRVKCNLVFCSKSDSDLCMFTEVCLYSCVAYGHQLWLFCRLCSFLLHQYALRMRGWSELHCGKEFHRSGVQFYSVCLSHCSYASTIDLILNLPDFLCYHLKILSWGVVWNQLRSQ